MSSLVDYTVLGLLIEKPSYGYEIYDRYERRFEDLVGESSLSNIYAVLKRLQREAMIEQTAVEVATGSEGRPRIYYRVTGAGAGFFRGWLAERMRDDRGRSELLSRLAATGMRQVDAMLEVMDRYEEECMKEAQRATTPGHDESPSADQEVELIKDLMAEERRRSIAAQIDWIDYARSRVRAYAAKRFPGQAG
jgi:DNA-binding PadR family transcriptional regulator